MFQRFLFSNIWSSAQDHALLVLLLNLAGFFIFTRPRWSGGNDVRHCCTSFKGASRGGQPLIFFTWFIGAGGGASCTGFVTHRNESCRTCARVMSCIEWSRVPGASCTGFVTHRNQSCRTDIEVMSRIWTCHVTHAWLIHVTSARCTGFVTHRNESCRTNTGSHIAHTNESCHTYTWDMSQVPTAQDSWRIEMRHLAHVDESCRAYN